MRALCAILTRDRPESLGRCLASVAAASPPEGVALEILVIDNASAEAAAARNRAFVADGVGPFPARIATERRRGIAIARNHALAAAEAGGFDALVFLDDDQTVPPDWFATAFRVLAEERVEIVRPDVRWDFEPPGRYRHEFEGRVPLDQRPLREAGGRQAATNGVVLDARLWREMGLRFDERFPLAGGEDTDFFFRATDAGARIVVTRESCSVEHCPAEKQRLGWLLRRSFRIGNNEALFRFKRYPRWRYVTAGVFQALWFGLVALVSLPAPSRALDAVLRAARGAGRAAGGASVVFSEYRATVGR